MAIYSSIGNAICLATPSSDCPPTIIWIEFLLYLGFVVALVLEPLLPPLLEAIFELPLPELLLFEETEPVCVGLLIIWKCIPVIQFWVMVV